MLRAARCCGKSLSWRRDLSGRAAPAKGVADGADWRKKKERRSFWAPPPCAMSASRPFGTISRRRETFRSLVTRSASRLPAKRRRDPTTVLILRRVATTRPRPWPGLNLWRRDLRRGAPFRLHLTALRWRRKTVALRACAPLRLQPSMAVDDPRLALPCELCRLLSGAFGFLRRHRSTIGAAHTEEHSAQRPAGAGGRKRLSTLSTGQPKPTERRIAWSPCLARAFPGKGRGVAPPARIFPLIGE